MPNSIAWTIMKTIEAICSRVHMIFALPIDRENAPRDRLCAGEGSPGVLWPGAGGALYGRSNGLGAGV